MTVNPLGDMLFHPSQAPVLFKRISCYNSGKWKGHLLEEKLSHVD